MAGFRHAYEDIDVLHEFLKAVLLDDADDTTSADREAGLAELLRDDVDRGVGIEKAVTDDLANDFVGADIVAFGDGLVA